MALAPGVHPTIRDIPPATGSRSSGAAVAGWWVCVLRVQLGLRNPSLLGTIRVLSALDKARFGASREKWHGAAVNESHTCPSWLIGAARSVNSPLAHLLPTRWSHRCSIGSGHKGGRSRTESGNTGPRVAALRFGGDPGRGSQAHHYEHHKH